MMKNTEAPASNDRDEDPGLLRRVEELEAVCEELVVWKENMERRLGPSEEPSPGTEEGNLELPL